MFWKRRGTCEFGDKCQYKHGPAPNPKADAANPKGDAKSPAVKGLIWKFEPEGCGVLDTGAGADLRHKEKVSSFSRKREDLPLIH